MARSRRDRPAHPRAGGENTTATSSAASMTGSSPRGRGKRQAGRHEAHADRLIPARAGKTKQDAQYTGHHPAHPRAGGENELMVSKARSLWGSSPRGRGKREMLAEVPGELRLIPARAGKTKKISCHIMKSEAHPRAGGENLASEYATASFVGSSPRGRGKLQVPRARPSRPRLIPARAGKTLSLLGGVVSRAAHPRAGGENSTSAPHTCIRVGSSPRGRGKRQLASRGWARTGLIPARAGKTPRTA